MSKSKLTAGEERPMRPDESDLVTLDATLLLAMETAKDRAFILDIESLIFSFIQNSQMERTELEPINSYYRLLVHRIARFYGVEHMIEPSRPAVMILSKTFETKMPLIRLFELIDRPAPHQYVRPDALASAQQQQQVPVKIMRRQPAPEQSDQSSAQSTPAAPSGDGREQAYGKVRAQIFSEEPEKPQPGTTEAASAAAAKDAKEKAIPAADNSPTERAGQGTSVEWNIDAAEFDPFARPSLLSTAVPLARPIFTKPIIDFEAVHLPQHIVLVRQSEPTTSHSASLQPFLEHLTNLLGQSWEIRTKPTHKDALLICSSAFQADQVLNEQKYKIPGFTVITWKPRYYSEP